MGAHEELEHAEHIGHSGGGHTTKHLGITMALLGVLIAFAAAMVGSQRQELMTTLLDQSWAHSSYTAAGVKLHGIMIELEKMKGTPSAPNLNRFIQLYSQTDQEWKLAKEWDDACEPLIDAHYDAAEGYEHAQLVAEVAIIIASVAVLLNSRPAWMVSLVIGVICVGLMGYTFVQTRAAVSQAHEKAHHAEAAFEHASESHESSTANQETINALDPGGKIRATLKEEPAKSEHETGKPEHAGETPAHEAEKPD